MSLSSNQLDAFNAISQLGSFSKASEHLHITQSALSQKIKLLEEELELTLFIRTPTGVRLTEQGEKLLRYCQMKETLENELLEELSIKRGNKLSGTIRIATYSSIYRSVILPALAPLIKNNPNVKVEFICCKMQELPQKLYRAEADFIILDYQLKKANLEEFILGKEKYIVIGSKSKNRMDTFLDNDKEDYATENFFSKQKTKSSKVTRSYYDDCYGIIDAVENGLGNAVMPEHLVANNKELKISKKFKPVSLDVVLHYHQQPFYSKLHQAIIENLKNNCPHYLS